MVCTRDAGSAFAWTRRYVACVLLVFVAARSVDAQSVLATNDPPPDTLRWRASHCLSGVTYGAPQKLAASYAGGFVREGVGDTASDYCAFAALKLGFGGVRGALGFAQAKGPLGSGAALSGNVLRTFSSPTGATAKRTYVGASLHVWPLLGVGGEIGYFVRLGDAAGAPSAQRRLVTWSVGFGY